MQPLLLLGLTQLYIVVATYWSFGLDGAICVRTLSLREADSLFA